MQYRSAGGQSIKEILTVCEALGVESVLLDERLFRQFKSQSKQPIRMLVTPESPIPWTPTSGSGEER